MNASGALDLGVVILAGGEATRLPGKLEADAGGLPLIVRVYRNVRAIGPTYVSARGSFAQEIDDALTCPVVIDRQPQLGPLGGLCSTFAVMRTARVFVVAGDAPFADAGTAAELAAAWTPASEAVVAVNADNRIEPLCAIYDRMAFLREGSQVLTGSRAVRDVVQRLRVRHVSLRNDRALFNINTAADHTRMSRAAAPSGES